jgi:hypothetical protein
MCLDSGTVLLLHLTVPFWLLIVRQGWSHGSGGSEAHAVCEWLAEATDAVDCWLPTYLRMYGE